MSADTLREEVIAALKTCFDPEIPVNIYDLGLIYVVAVSEEAEVAVAMTLTSPNCPVAETLPLEVQTTVEGVPGVKSASVDVVWDPPWSEDRLSEAARLELGLI